jgi:multiple sugar transport system permease protein
VSTSSRQSASNRQSASWSVARHAILGASSLAVATPFVWMLLVSVKPADADLGSAVGWLSGWVGLQNYHRALQLAPLGRFLANGVLICASILILQVLIAIPAAYALAKLRFPGRRVLCGMAVAGILVPQQVLALPLFMVGARAGLLDSYAALILPFAVSPFAIVLLRQVFAQIPDDLVHAARLDGMSEGVIAWRVLTPLARPAILAFAVLSLVAHWNDLFWPLIVMRSSHLMPPAIGVLAFRSAESGADYGTLMAGSTIIVTPLIVLFLLAQRRATDAVAQGGVK